MYIENSVKTSTREKARAKNAVINYVYEYCKDNGTNVIAFNLVEDKVYDECKDMTYIECIRVFRRVLDHFGFKGFSGYIPVVGCKEC